MKSIISLLTMAPDRATAANWANELEKHGFAHHSAEEIKKSLQASAPLLFKISFYLYRAGSPRTKRTI